MVEQNPRLEFLKKEIAARRFGLVRRSNYYQATAFWPFMISVVLSAIVTVLLGFNDPGLRETFRLTALGLTAIVTIANAYNSFYSNRQLWVANNKALNRLYRLIFDIAYSEQGDHYVSDTETEAFRATYQCILDELNAAWEKNREGKKLSA